MRSMYGRQMPVNSGHKISTEEMTVLPAGSVRLRLPLHRGEIEQEQIASRLACFLLSPDELSVQKECEVCHSRQTQPDSEAHADTDATADLPESASQDQKGQQPSWYHLTILPLIPASRASEEVTVGA